MLKNLILILFGLAGSGKGTQSSALEEKMGFKRFVAGDIIRDYIKYNPEDPEVIAEKKLLSQGKITTNDFVYKVFVGKIDEYLSKNPDFSGIVLDGFPRTLDQNNFLLTNGSVASGNCMAIYLELSEREVIDRIKNRINCNGCKATYNLLNYRSNTCEVCGDGLNAREDDTNLESVRKRLDIFYEQTMPVIDFYKKAGKLHAVDGSQKQDLVFQSIVDKVNQNKS